MTTQVLFFDVFSEKGPQLNVAEKFNNKLRNKDFIYIASTTQYFI